MARAGGLAAAYELDRWLDEPWLEKRPEEREDRIAGRQRAAAATLVMVAWGLFMAPPLVALLVLTGLLR